MKPRLPVVGPFRIDLGIGCGKGMFIAAVAGDQMHVGRDRLFLEASLGYLRRRSANLFRELDRRDLVEVRHRRESGDFPAGDASDKQSYEQSGSPVPGIV